MSFNQKLTQEFINALRANDFEKAGQVHDRADIIPLVRAVNDLGAKTDLLQPLATYLSDRFGVDVGLATDNVGFRIIVDNLDKSSLAEVVYNNFEVKRLLDTAGAKYGFDKAVEYFQASGKIDDVSPAALKDLLERSVDRYQTDKAILAELKTAAAEAKELREKEPAKAPIGNLEAAYKIFVAREKAETAAAKALITPARKAAALPTP